MREGLGPRFLPREVRSVKVRGCLHLLSQQDQLDLHSAEIRTISFTFGVDVKRRLEAEGTNSDVGRDSQQEIGEGFERFLGLFSGHGLYAWTWRGTERTVHNDDLIFATWETRGS